tara:strand:- start:14513 stop:15325 length:813 start_codon:yes stop_codon:yes gene_type:complete
MLGLILGETQLGNLIIKKLKFLKKKFIIIDISKKKIFSKYKNSYSLSIGQLGKAISILKKNDCKNIIFAGKISRPNFSKTKFDFKALYYLPSIIKAAKKGDAFIIKIIIKIFKKHGFKIINSMFFNKELILKKGNYTKTKPNDRNKKDILKGKIIVTDLKEHNVGQAVVIRGGYVIAIEGQNGTDEMLKRANLLIKRVTTKNKRDGVLLKFPKQNQDLRVDLPTIGIKTINKCVKIGLKGIAVKANRNIFLDNKKCIYLANKNKMFISAI